jgi:hypothetical protein
MNIWDSPRSDPLQCLDERIDLRLRPGVPLLATDKLVEMANLTAAQTCVSGTIFVSTAMGSHGPQAKCAGGACNARPWRSKARPNKNI